MKSVGANITTLLAGTTVSNSHPSKSGIPILPLANPPNLCNSCILEALFLTVLGYLTTQFNEPDIASSEKAKPEPVATYASPPSTATITEEFGATPVSGSSPRNVFHCVYPLSGLIAIKFIPVPSKIGTRTKLP